MGKWRPMAGGDRGGGWAGAVPGEGGARGRQRRRRRLQQRRRRPRQKHPGPRQVRSAGRRAGGGQVEYCGARGTPTCWWRSRGVPRPAFDRARARGASERGTGSGARAGRPPRLATASAPRCCASSRWLAWSLGRSRSTGKVQCSVRVQRGPRVAGRTPRLEGLGAGGLEVAPLRGR